MTITKFNDRFSTVTITLATIALTALLSFQVATSLMPPIVGLRHHQAGEKPCLSPGLLQYGDAPTSPEPSARQQTPPFAGHSLRPASFFYTL